MFNQLKLKSMPPAGTEPTRPCPERQHGDVWALGDESCFPPPCAYTCADILFSRSHNVIFDHAFLEALTAEGPVEIREVGPVKVKLERPCGGGGIAHT